MNRLASYYWEPARDLEPRGVGSVVAPRINITRERSAFRYPPEVVPPEIEPLDDIVPESLQGYLSPLLTPWGCDVVTAEGKIILPGATGAAAAVGTSATAVVTADPTLSVAAKATANIASYTIPPNRIGILRGYYARPWSKLGYDTGHVTFAVLAGGRQVPIPNTIGLRGDFKNLIPIYDVARPNQVVAVQGTNGSTATWHRVDAVLEILLVPIERFRKYVDPHGV